MIFINKYSDSLLSSGVKLSERLGYQSASLKFGLPRDELFINWGLSSIPWLKDEDLPYTLNEPRAVALAVNKLTSLHSFKRDSLKAVPFSDNIQEAASFFMEEGDIVFCRTSLNSSCGRGIVVARCPSDLVYAPLYTLYIKKRWELRVHVIGRKAFHIQQKRKLSPDKFKLIRRPNSLIRNLDNGYIFSTNISTDLSDIIPEVEQEAILAISSLGLDFGAVDIIVTENKQMYLLEVNTAPGLTGTTLDKYVDIFKEVLSLNH